MINTVSSTRVSVTSVAVFVAAGGKAGRWRGLMGSPASSNTAPSFLPGAARGRTTLIWRDQLPKGIRTLYSSAIARLGTEAEASSSKDPDASEAPPTPVAASNVAKRPAGAGSGSGPRRKSGLLVSDVLQHDTHPVWHFQIDVDATLDDAIRHMVAHGVGVCITVEGGELVGIVTARDTLRALAKGSPMAEQLDVPLREIMTPAPLIVSVEPGETMSTASELMSEIRVRHIPVIEGGRLVGMIQHHQLSDIVNLPFIGGKNSAVGRVLSRRGVEASAASQPADAGAVIGVGASQLVTAAAERTHLTLQTAATVRASISKPSGQRPEDSVSVRQVLWPQPGVQPLPLTYIAVADGVGSWRAAGIDPSEFPTTLTSAIEDFVGETAEEACLLLGSQEGAESPDGVEPVAAPPSPLDCLQSGWVSTVARGVEGSSTAIVAVLDPKHAQIAAANVGDSGMYVLRKVDVAMSGAVALEQAQAVQRQLRRRVRKKREAQARRSAAGVASGAQSGRGSSSSSSSSSATESFLSRLPRSLAELNRSTDDGTSSDEDPHGNGDDDESDDDESDDEEDDDEEEAEAYPSGESVDPDAWQVVYRSVQQLHGFNRPFQIGNQEGAPAGSFDEPSDADVMRVPVESGDVVLLATDGLFDNVHEEELLRIVAWSEARAAAERLTDEEHAERLATALADRAVDLSGDREHDGPFAILAKENGILWSQGGRPDDISVVVAIVRQDA